MSAKWKKSTGQMDKTKSNIFSEFESFVKTKWEEETLPLVDELEQEEIWLMCVGTEKPHKLYFQCRSDTALKKLVELMLSGHLDVILQTKVHECIENDGISLQLNCKASVYEHCKGYYKTRPVGE